jgi:hypothetical protein
MIELTTEEYWEIFYGLPKKTQQKILSMELVYLMESISQKYKMSSSTAALFPSRVGRLLMGVLSEEEFALWLTEEGLDTEDAISILSEVQSDTIKTKRNPYREEI